MATWGVFLEPIGCGNPNTGSTDPLLFPKLMVLNLGAGRVSNKAGPVMLRSGLRYKEPTPTKVNALVGVSLESAGWTCPIVTQAVIDSSLGEQA